jgi:STE24 endopeptidase
METFFNTHTLVALFILVYFIEAMAKYLNFKTSQAPLPPELRDLQTPDAQLKASQYLRERIILATLRDAFFLILFLVLLTQGFFGWLQNFAFGLSPSILIQSLVFAGVLIAGQSLLEIPFSAYSTFKIESRYGFNRTSVVTFTGDLVKGAVVGGILGGLIFSFIVYMLGTFGEHSWIAIWLGYTALQFFLVWIAPVALLPLFLKLSPLPDGELLTAINAYSEKQSFKLDGVWVCDASKRSAKSNAFFTGFGKFRRLVLFDTLIEKHSQDEIVAIVAHEAGHFKLGHIWQLSLFSGLSTLVFFFLIQQMVGSDALYHTFKTQNTNVGIGLVLATIVIGKLGFFFSPIRSYFSRRNEYAADHFSLKTTGDARALADGLKRLVTDNLATLQHHPLYVILHDSHPPLPDRLKPLQNRAI